MNESNDRRKRRVENKVGNEMKSVSMLSASKYSFDSINENLKM